MARQKTQTDGLGLGNFDTRIPTHARAKLQKSLAVGASIIRRGGDLIEPPYPIARLIQFLSASPSLRPAIDAYSINIDSFGQTLVPTLDLARDDIAPVVRSAMVIERRLEAERLLVEEGVVTTVAEPTPAEVKARVKELAAEQEDERQELDFWLKSVCPDLTFTQLRRKTRVDLELTGNAYWEVRRDGLGAPRQINHVPVASIVATTQGDPVDVTVRLHRTPITVSEIVQSRRFRRYVQMGGAGKHVYYKEHGDRRLMSAATGKFYPDARAMKTEEPEAKEATELRHFRIATPASEVYGVPRWEGCIVGLLGSRAAEEVNFLYFNNKSIPPLAILVSGATVSKETIDELRDTIASDLHGVKNFHRALLIQATASDSAISAGTAKIELKPLMQVSEGQFMVYIEKNAAALVGAFRLPQLYRGQTDGYNKANAQVAVETTEQQVFQPERDDFDSLINRFFLYDLGIRYWRIKSNGPPPANLERRAEILIEAADAGVATLNEARQVLSEFYGRELERIASPWADLPCPVALESARLAEVAKNPPLTPAKQDFGSTDGQQADRPKPRRRRRKAVSDTGAAPSA